MASRAVGAAKEEEKMLGLSARGRGDTLMTAYRWRTKCFVVRTTGSSATVQMS